jgi:transcriptional regulator with XRE-family HTH domain
LENSKTKLSVDRLFQIAELLKVPVTELLNTSPATTYNQNNSDNATGYIQQIENLYQDKKNTYHILIDKLNEEIQYLKEQNTKLLEALTNNK